MDEVLQLGGIPMRVRSLNRAALDGLPRSFVALVPANDLARHAATMQLVGPLLDAGSTELILGGPRADAFHQHVGLAIEQRGVETGCTPMSEIGDACNAALLGALIHKAGVALCAEEPAMLETLRGIAEFNGWSAKPAAKRPTMPGTKTKRPTQPIEPPKAKRPTQPLEAPKTKRPTQPFAAPKPAKRPTKPVPPMPKKPLKNQKKPKR
jgi:hypothetical protein